jgi:hypothetical protein
MCSRIPNLQPEAQQFLSILGPSNFLPLYRRYKMIIFNSKSHVLRIPDRDLNIWAYFNTSNFMVFCVFPYIKAATLSPDVRLRVQLRQHRGTGQCLPERTPSAYSRLAQRRRFWCYFCLVSVESVRQRDVGDLCQPRRSESSKCNIDRARPL